MKNTSQRRRVSTVGTILSGFILAAVGLPVSALAQEEIIGEASEARSDYVGESVEVSNHYVFNTDSVVDGATVLVRDFKDGTVSASISSRALDPETAYSIWWAVFNRPQYCEEPYRCGVTDLPPFGGDPRIRASVFWGGGFVSDPFGMANSSLKLRVGRTSRELFAQTQPYGLGNIRKAEIHVVLRSHGPIGIAGSVAEQIGTATLACPDEGCVNTFASIHIPE